MIPRLVRLVGRTYVLEEFPEICALAKVVCDGKASCEECEGLRQLAEAIRSAEMSAIEEAEELCCALGAQRIAQTRLQA